MLCSHTFSSSPRLRLPPHEPHHDTDPSSHHTVQLYNFHQCGPKPASKDFKRVCDAKHGAAAACRCTFTIRPVFLLEEKRGRATVLTCGRMGDIL